MSQKIFVNSQLFIKIIKFFSSIMFLLASTVIFLFQLSKSRSFQFFGEIVPRIKTEQKIVALTFDDAPSGDIETVLQTLQDKQVKATFYVVGKSIEDHPEAMKKIIDRGMEVGNHSYTHQRFLLKSPHFIDQELQTTNRLMGRYPKN
ncbi:MAG: polysaccharide deacetylase family protein [Patescibacteria group bacterium]